MNDIEGTRQISFVTSGEEVPDNIVGIIEEGIATVY